MTSWKDYHGSLHIHAVACQGYQLYLAIDLPVPQAFLPQWKWVKCTFPSTNESRSTYCPWAPF